MQQKYAVKIYERDDLKYQTEITSEDIHEDMWDIISDAITAAYPDDNMSTPRDAHIDMAYESAEFDECGFFGYFGLDDGCMIVATRV